jgi:hypothetical protein
MFTMSPFTCAASPEGPVLKLAQSVWYSMSWTALFAQVELDNEYAPAD